MRTYGCFFAEFLNEDSPVRLGLLDQPTCVGFRYGRLVVSSRRFSWKLALQNFPSIATRNFHGIWNQALPSLADLPTSIPYAAYVKSNNAPGILRFVPPLNS